MFSMHFWLTKIGPCAIHWKKISTCCGGLSQVFVLQIVGYDGSLSLRVNIKAGCQVNSDPLKYEAAV